MDAALAALICNGLVNMQSLGFGGGFMMTIYERSTRRAFVLNARDRAPLAANFTMYNGRPSNVSSLGKLHQAFSSCRPFKFQIFGEKTIMFNAYKS